MQESIVVRYKKIHPDAVTPEYKTGGAVAFDLGLIEDVTIPPRSFVKTPTGLVITVPVGHFLAVASRSSNPGKKGIDLANSIGIFDNDYCGPTDEVMLMLENITDAEVRLAKGDRVAQGVILPIPKVELREITEDISEDDRGGFGTTGG